MRSVRTALAAGLVLTVAAGIVVLSQHPLAVLAANTTATSTELGVTGTDAQACQGGERLPAGTTAIRLSLGAFTGPAMKLTVLSAGHMVTSGERGSGWDGETVTVPVRALSAPVSPASICFAIPLTGVEPVRLLGSDTSHALAVHAGNGQALAGRLRIEYLGRARSSWLTQVPTVARHMGLGRAWSGIWVVFALVVAMLAVTGLATGLIARESHE
ncbi:MAG: hypothetical protein ABR992_18515 [Solirubrobacteraceae bacterium]|jgi:hypothetical protein